MEIKATNTASLNSKTIHKLQDLLVKFELGLFKAIITNKINHDTFLINSQAGTLQIKSQLNLLIGDELTLNIKLATSSQTETLVISKIERPLPSTAPNLTTYFEKKSASVLLLSNKGVLALIPKNQSHYIVSVVAHDKNSIHLSDLKGNLFTIDKNSFQQSSINIKQGQHLVIKWASSDTVEIQAVSKEQLLHQALRQLLPKTSTSNQTHQRLTQAAFKLFQAIDNEALNLTKIIKLQNSSSDAKLTKTNLSRIQSQIKALLNSKVQISKSASFIAKNENTLSKSVGLETKLLSLNNETSNKQQTLNSLKLIKQELHQLLKTHTIKLNSLSTGNIHKLLINLNVVSKAIASGENSPSFIQKLTMIIQSIDQLLADTDTNPSKNKHQHDEPNILNDVLKMALKEAKQSFESSIHKLMLQTTTSKLNQEVNLSHLINTHIPFELDKHTKDVALKIKQHKNTNDEDDDSWEIQLSLEMGELGLISTKILLKNSSELSVLFWAELENTKHLLDSKKGIFQQQMKNAGFKLLSFNVFLGQIESNDVPLPMNSHTLIDINA